MRLEILLFLKRFKRPFLILCFTVFWAYANAQEINVSGTITEESGSGLPGVSILVKGASIGTISDVEGNYSLNVPSNDAVLVFSYVGFITEEVAVNGKSVINLTMTPDITSLEEIVVIGYGAQKKSLVTGAISSVKADELQTVSTARIDQALQGRTAGVAITPNSGSPGAGTKIRIRGAGSNGNSNPLYIIDGVRTGADGMDYLSPNDVASIEILKDAASAAIYGAEGANGVVIVTTKSGNPNTSQIHYSAQFGQQSVSPDIMQMMNPAQYQEYLEEAGFTSPTIPTATEAANVTGTDWLSEVFETAPQQSHSLSFSGGTEKSTYFVSGNYFSQEGIVGGEKSKFNRYSIRINSNHDIKPWLTIGENLSYSNIQKRGITEDNEFGSILSSALSLDPLTPVTYTGDLPDHVVALQSAYLPDDGDPATPLQPIAPLLKRDGNGNYYGISNYVQGEYGNPIGAIDLEKTKTTQNKILGNIYVDIKPFKGFKLTSRLGIDAAFQRNHNWNPTFYFSSINLNALANASDSWDEWYTWQWENFASYNRAIGGHNITLLGGISMQKYTFNNVNGSYSGLFREEEKWSYARYVGNDDDRIDSRPEYRGLNSYFGRLSYDFRNKYQLEATLRRDGSSMLAENHQWGTFPSVSVGWVITNENFFPAGIANVVSFAKLRASWGQNGSLSNLSPGQWQAAISTDVNGIIRYPDPNEDYLPGAAPTQLPNPELTWETSEQLDIGLDISLLNDQVSLTADYFKKTTKDLITGGNPPGIAGAPLPFINAGTVENKGFEFEISYRNSPERAFRYEIAGNFTTLNNEVTGISASGAPPAGANIGTHWNQATAFAVGEPIWYFRGYKTKGIFQDDEQIDAYIAENGLKDYNPIPGDPIIVNMNADSLISPADYTNIGNPHPDFYYGARLNLEYKGFDFLVFVQGQVGNDILLGFIRTDRGTANKPLFFYEDRWTGEGSTNSWFRANTSGDTYTSDMMVFNGSYARIRQLQLGYTIPNAVSENIGVKNARVYVSLDNYFTFTNYPGLDPEAGSNNNNSIGIDRGVYPIPRTILGGISFSF